MKILVNSMTQEEFNQYLERVVESAFREGMLWAKWVAKGGVRNDDEL